MDSYDKLFDKILSEIKETEKRDLNNFSEDINDITYQPGFVKLVKNKFSFNFQKNYETKANILHNKYGANLKIVDTSSSKSNDFKLTSNIHYGDLFSKNIVSDTRRVFESIVPKDHSISKLSNNSLSTPTKSIDKRISNYNNIKNVEENTNLITKFISKEIFDTKKAENTIVENVTCDVIDFISLRSKDSAEYDKNRSSFLISNTNFLHDNSKCLSKMNLPPPKPTLSKSFVFNACDFKKPTVDMRVNILDDSINDEFITDNEISLEIVENKLTNANSILKSILKNNTTEIKNKTFKTCRFAVDKLIETIHVYENEYSFNNDDEFNDILCNSQNQKVNWKHEIGHSRLINNHENIPENKKIEFKSDLLF